MMRHRLRARTSGESGFTLIELLVVVLIIGILAAIALAVFLSQRDKGADADAKSNVTNVARLTQACAAGNSQGNDFTNCNDTASIQPESITLDPRAPAAPSGSGGDCAGAAGAGVAANFDVRLFEEGKDCFTLVGESNSGNKFWYIRHNDGSVSRDCLTHNQGGCPADGQWAR